MKRTKGLNRRTPPRPARQGVSPASRAQRLKVRNFGCLVCTYPEVDPAHLVPRSLGGCDHPECVLPMCRVCHRGHDSHELDIISFLEPRWRVGVAHAVLYVGLEGVRRLVVPSAYQHGAVRDG